MAWPIPCQGPKQNRGTRPRQQSRIPTLCYCKNSVTTKTASEIRDHLRKLVCRITRDKIGGPRITVRFLVGSFEPVTGSLNIIGGDVVSCRLQHVPQCVCAILCRVPWTFADQPFPRRILATFALKALGHLAKPAPRCRVKSSTRPANRPRISKHSTVASVSSRGRRSTASVTTLEVAGPRKVFLKMPRKYAAVSIMAAKATKPAPVWVFRALSKIRNSAGKPLVPGTPKLARPKFTASGMPPWNAVWPRRVNRPITKISV
jgi:hypothetical protein